MNKIIFFTLFLGCIACGSVDEQDDCLKGIVINETSCNGGPEPVFIIKLGDLDSIITATLLKEFQIPGLNIKFKTKKETPHLIFCTTDKIYPEYFDVYDVSKL